MSSCKVDLDWIAFQRFLSLATAGCQVPFMDGHRIALLQEITKIISVFFMRNAQSPFMNMIYSIIHGPIIKHPHKWAVAKMRYNKRSH